MRLDSSSDPRTHPLLSPGRRCITALLLDAPSMEDLGDAVSRSIGFVSGVNLAVRHYTGPIEAGLQIGYTHEADDEWPVVAISYAAELDAEDLREAEFLVDDLARDQPEATFPKAETFIAIAEIRYRHFDDPVRSAETFALYLGAAYALVDRFGGILEWGHGACRAFTVELGWVDY